eukprot:59917_1
MVTDKPLSRKEIHRRKVVLSRIRNASVIKSKASLCDQGIESCDDVAVVIKETSRQIRALQYDGIKKLKRKLFKQRKLHCISLSRSASNLQKKLACLPRREIERQILEFNGEQLECYGFEWKLYTTAHSHQKYRKLRLTQWIECECSHSNMITHKRCIIHSFIQSFILGAACMKFNTKHKDLGVPKRDQVLKTDSINEACLVNLLLRVQYQSLCVHITDVSFDLFNRNDKTGYLSIKPSVHSREPNAKPKHLWKVLFQEHNAFVMLKKRSNHRHIFFGVALHQRKPNQIRIKVHHKNIAMYDVDDANEEWIVYVAPYCVKHALMALFQRYIDKTH